MKKQIKAFTIVELIVVITILAVLWTIWFVSYVWHISTSRDATRLAQVQLIYQAFGTYTKGRLPLPTNKVTITASGTIIWYQWYVWDTVLSDINIEEWWKDPLDNGYYTYFVDDKRRELQLLTLLENEESVAYNKLTPNSLLPNVYATDYSERYAKPYWSKLWILTESGTNAPIQENTTLQTTWLDVVTTNNTYTAYFKPDEYITGTGKVLQKLQQSIWHWWVGMAAPSDCPTWFIRVPGNIEFNQPGFCVAKYEMTYSDATIPNSCDTQYPTTCTNDYERNTVRYEPWKTIISSPWLYPIANITQIQAIEACKSIWAWYHLITNDEWMTIARDIEQQWINWSSWQVGSGYIYNWVSDSAMWCWDTTNTKTIYTSLTRNRATKTWEWFGNTVCDTKRQLRLSNWEIILDLSGNLIEHTNKANTLDWLYFNSWKFSIAWSSNWIWVDDNGIYDINEMKKYWSNLWLWIVSGMWNLRGANWVDNNIFLRGATANMASDAGIFMIDLTRPSINQRRDVGFRCAK